jgi:hypothetical protein
MKRRIVRKSWNRLFKEKNGRNKTLIITSKTESIFDQTYKKLRFLIRITKGKIYSFNGMTVSKIKK